jgi:carboxymethylenebutenolidase
MGGRITWLGAATNPHFKAAVPYYGGNIMVPRGSATQTPFDRSGGIGCPVLFHFGELDLNPSRVDMQTLDAELTRLDVQHQFHSYPGADHAFMDSTGGRYHKQSAEDSWPRTLEFLAQYLKGAPVSR